MEIDFHFFRCACYNTFCGCASLTSITIPNSANYIGSEAFGGCTSLSSIGIPEVMQLIDWYAFRGCTGLADVYYGGSVAEWAEIKIGGENDCLRNANIHCAKLPGGLAVDKDGNGVVDLNDAVLWLKEPADDPAAGYKAAQVLLYFVGLLV